MKKNQVRIKLNQKGGLNIVSLIFFVLLIVGGWAAYSFALAYYSKAEVKSIENSSIVSNYRQGPEKIEESISEGLRRVPNTEFSDKSIQVTKDENKPIFTAHVQYNYLVTVPVWKRVYKFPLKVVITIDMSLENSLR